MDKLKAFRNTTGLSQDNMARKIGVSLSMYQKVERGAVRATRGFMDKLKAAYPHVSIDVMFFSEASKKSKRENIDE